MKSFLKSAEMMFSCKPRFVWILDNYAADGWITDPQQMQIMDSWRLMRDADFYSVDFEHNVFFLLFMAAIAGEI